MISISLSQRFCNALEHSKIGPISVRHKFIIDKIYIPPIKVCGAISCIPLVILISQMCKFEMRLKCRFFDKQLLITTDALKVRIARDSDAVSFLSLSLADKPMRQEVGEASSVFTPEVA
jgi:hypothetical protein